MARTANRDLYAQVGIIQIPHIMSLVDRNALSPTYGCFDRPYWHYKTSAFSSGMYQEFVLPLALLYRFRFPGGETYHAQPRLRELAIAGIRYADRSSHSDGSCDDYFPYERALGAVAFSLYATTEAYLLLELHEEDMVAFFRRRTAWLLARQEPGRLSNHHALSVLALYNVYLITGDQQIAEGMRRRLAMVLQWQTQEGWFPEYEGCDPGYLTATIDFLAKYHKKSYDASVLEPLCSAVRFASQFVHPDGSFGGEYGSRNTCLFFPHGFELMSPYLPEARRTADVYIARGIQEDKRVHLDDDRMCAHLSYNHLQAYLDFCEETTYDSQTSIPKSRYWSGARLYVHRDSRRYAVVSTGKGGVIRLYTGEKLTYADSGIIARLADGTTLVSHQPSEVDVVLEEGKVQVSGHFGRVVYRLPTVFGQALFHLGMLTIGRFGSNVVRTLLQKVLIVGQRKDPMRFRRTILFDDRVTLVDEIWEERGRHREVVSLFAGTDHTSIYVAVSQSFHSGCLFPWTDYGAFLETLIREGYVRIERELG